MTAAEAARPRLAVQKFGGTSVASPQGRVAVRARVRARVDEGARVVVVISAMGRLGAPYATDTLLGLLGDLPVDPREADLLSSCGEVIAAVVLAHELRVEGVPAHALTGREAGVVTDGVFGNATVLGVDPRMLGDLLDRGLVPVVAGFQGATAAGQTTTLGRGGSDTTACAIGSALRADVVEIHSDVDGVMSADPRVCDEARLLDSLQFEELFQMARSGAKVMHAPAAEIAMAAGIPIRVLNTAGADPGTLVADASSLTGGLTPRIATAVSHSDGISRFVVTLPGGPRRSEAITALFRSMADASVSLDMFTPLADVLAFSVETPCANPAEGLLGDLGLAFERRDDLAKVTLVGAGMHGVPGVMARVAEALTSSGIEILQSADSHYTISVLIATTDLHGAIDSLHGGFGLGVE